MYLLDSNAFIEPFNNYYPFDLVPEYWRLIDAAFDRSLLVSLKFVQDELKRSKDDLADWARDRDAGFFVTADSPEVQKHYSNIIAWVVSQGFTDKAKADFAMGADGWLVAYAMEHNCTLVTQEQLKPTNTQKHVSIVNISHQFGVQCIKAVELFKRLKALIDTSPLYPPA